MKTVRQEAADVFQHHLCDWQARYWAVIDDIIWIVQRRPEFNPLLLAFKIDADMVNEAVLSATDGVAQLDLEDSRRIAEALSLQLLRELERDQRRTADGQATELVDDFAAHYGHLPVMSVDPQAVLDNYVTGDEAGWAEEEAELALDECLQSVRRHGVVHPITIGSDGRVLDGHHRLLAAVRLGLRTVPVRLAIMPVAGANTKE